MKGAGTFRRLPEDKGVAAIGQAVLRCGSGDVYFAAHWNGTYEEALLDSVDHSAAAYAKIKKTTFQNFLDATADARSCPDVTLP
ncbi:hypothetical protein ACFRLW_09955 [Streptomyces sp. NPDC056728]